MVLNLVSELAQYQDSKPGVSRRLASLVRYRYAGGRAERASSTASDTRAGRAARRAREGASGPRGATKREWREQPEYEDSKPGVSRRLASLVRYHFAGGRAGGESVDFEPQELVFDQV